MKTRSFSVLALTLMLFGLAACGGAGAPDDAAPAVTEAVEESAATSVSEGVLAEAAGSLVIYSGRSESLVQPIIDRFEAETGIDVQVRYGSTAEMAGVLLEEGTNSPADLFYAQDPGGLGAVQTAGLLQVLPDDILARVSGRFRANDGSWVGVSGRARVVVYNTAAIADPAASLPADIYDFVSPEWTGRLGWAPTNASFQAMVTAMRVLWGEERTREWLTGIQANEPMAYEGNTQVVEAVAAGEVDAGFVNHYYLYRFLAEQGEAFPARNYFLPGGGPGSLMLVSGAGVLSTAPNAGNAQRFIDYLLSAEGQQYFADETFEYPVIAGVTLPASLPPLAELDTVAVDISLADLADVQGTQDMLIDLGIIE